MSKSITQNEEEILKFWREKKIFEKSVKNRPESKPYVFYDGPPFATGLPHYGHIVASLMKDVVPRYWTMKGFRVERKWGWDCHGLPIENIVEKELGLKSRKDIENYGVDKFNSACHAAVLKYANEWKKTIEKMGRWVDMDNDYKTMDIDYMESIWWVFKELWNKKLIYKSYKAMHICPRCETPLSNFEVTQGYKTVKDISLTVKFQVLSSKFQTNSKLQIPNDKPLYILAWTTTPWTLPGNVALAVNASIKYQVLSIMGEDGLFIIAKDRVTDVIKEKKYKVEKEIIGADLVGLEYEPLFPYFKNTKNAFRVIAADFVTTQDGTGVVHIAPAFGEDDFEVGKKENIGWVQHVGMDGRFTAEIKDFAGTEVKPKEDPTSADIKIIKWLAKENKIFSKEKFEHSYPHCWRCDSPLLNYATTSWFVRVTELKKDLIKNNKKINWVPEHIKDGRFGMWLKGARDWAISRNRFWGTPLPVWANDDNDFICIGSVQELEKLSGKKITDIHKHLMDKIVIVKDGKKYHRVPEVLDCWFESGGMPYGEMHYPFENKAKFEAGFPAEFIAEGQDQTRGWFYTLHILATALSGGKNPSIPTKGSQPAFKNVIVNGIVLAEDGKKMSKRLKNYPDPMEILQKYGADAMRYYLVSSPVMYAENLNFSENEVREMYNKFINTLKNVSDLYFMNASGVKIKTASKNVLDKWILTKLTMLKKETTEAMDAYKLAEGSRPILNFITELSQWYVRRSRDRIKSGDAEAIGTTQYVLGELVKICAPFTPFIAEDLYQKLNLPNKKESVHLENWLKVRKQGSKKTKKQEYEEKLLTEMETARKVVEAALAIRAEKGIKVRQPLAELQITNYELRKEIADIVAEEINVKKITSKKGKVQTVELDLKITPELRDEGVVREFVRGINALRKTAGLTPQDSTVIYIDADHDLAPILKKYETEILKSVIGKSLKLQKADTKFSSEIKLESETVWVGIKL